jgi:hypothetical protein
MRARRPALHKKDIYCRAGLRARFGNILKYANVFMNEYTQWLNENPFAPEGEEAGFRSAITYTSTRYTETEHE